jgi:hypothetical protein
MKHFLILVFTLVMSFNAFPKTNIDSLLDELNAEIAKEDVYLAAKYQRIEYYKKQESDKKFNTDLNFQFQNYLNLYNEYKSFIYDSAFTYAMKLQQTAYKLNDRNKIAISTINFGFILISSGMFKEAFDTIQKLSTKEMPDTILLQYYSLKARAYLDLVGYDRNVYYSSIYNTILNQYLDSTLNLCEKNSRNYLYYLGLKYIENGNIDQAQTIYEELINRFNLDFHLYAMTASGLAYVYLSKGQSFNAIRTLAEAVKADIKSSTKETIAAHKLAELLYDKGYVKEAYFYIKMAMNDASFYKTNLRKNQISYILPVIEGQEITTANNQKVRLFRYSIVTTVLSILIVISLLVTYKNLLELKKAKIIIMDSNNKLLESNKIKDEYIGYYFNISSEYLDKIEKFKKTINRKLVTRRIEDIQAIINNIDLVEEREELFSGFDKVFLKLFPDFVIRFNSLLKEEERITLKDNQLLNTDLRIFALIRIGIDDHDKISKILGYSVSTIYNYKTRIRKKSIFPGELFEEKLMEIKTI